MYRLICVVGAVILIFAVIAPFILPYPLKFMMVPLAIVGGWPLGWYWSRAFGNDSHDEY